VKTLLIAAGIGLAGTAVGLSPHPESPRADAASTWPDRLPSAEYPGGFAPFRPTFPARVSTAACHAPARESAGRAWEPHDRRSVSPLCVAPEWPAKDQWEDDATAEPAAPRGLTR
jgi:hypothetical protein